MVIAGSTQVDTLSGMVVHACTRVLRTACSILLIGAVAAGLGGCAPAGVTADRVTPTPSEPASQETEQAPAPEEPVQLVPGGGAEANLPFFSEVLRQFSAGTEVVGGRSVVDALVAAGFDRAAMQVSFDRSKTGLVADSILVSVLLDGECLIGQVVTADRSAVATIAPALTEGQNLCLIGNTRPIDW